VGGGGKEGGVGGDGVWGPRWEGTHACRCLTDGWFGGGAPRRKIGGVAYLRLVRGWCCLPRGAAFTVKVVGGATRKKKTRKSRGGRRLVRKRPRSVCNQEFGRGARGRDHHRGVVKDRERGEVGFRRRAVWVNRDVASKLLGVKGCAPRKVTGPKRH